MKSVYKILFVIFFLFLTGGIISDNALSADFSIDPKCNAPGRAANYCDTITKGSTCDGSGRCIVLGGQTSETGGQSGNIGGQSGEIGWVPDPNTYYFGSYAGQTSAELICSITNLVSKTLLPPIAVLMALVVGFLFLTSQGEPQKISLATKVLLATLIGVFLLLVAPGIIALINDLFISDGVNLESPSCDPAVTTNTIITALLNLVNLFAWFSAVVAVAMGLYSGFLYLTARGNPQQARQATMVFSYTIIGIAVSVVAFSIIAIAQQFIGYP